MENNDDCETCWICLEGVEGAVINPGSLHANRLIKPCRCPRVVHSVCLAKWQLSQSGRSEEKFCRFCKERLPDWQANLALPGMGAVEPVMSVHFNGQTHMVKVKSGEEGRVAFIQDVRRLLRLRENQEFSITFECKVPGHGMFLDLKGLSSYDAAVFCAAMTAVERQRLAAHKAQKNPPMPLGPRRSAGAGDGVPLPTCASAPDEAPAADLVTTGGTQGNVSSSSSIASGSSTSSDVAGCPSAGSTQPPAATSSTPSRAPTRAAPGSLAGSAEHSTGASHMQSRAATGRGVDSLTAAAAAAAADGALGALGRGQGGSCIGSGRDGLSGAEGGTCETMLAGAFTPATGSGGWEVHGPSLAGREGLAQDPAADPADLAGPSAHSGGARSLSGPPQAGAGGAERTARRAAAGAGPAAGWDSACEVEPSAAAGEVTAGSSGAGRGSAAAGSASDGRHKPLPCLRLGGSFHLPALSEQSRRGGGGGAANRANWLSRLFLCTSFGAGQ